MKDPRVVIVHDYLTQRGGAERVVLAMLRTFPDAQLVTGVYDPDGTFPDFKAYRISTLWLNRLPVVRRDIRYALPFAAAAFSSRRITDADVVLCSSSGWAHGVRSSSNIPKIVYCHNPPRWLYQSSDYLAGQPAMATVALKVLGRGLRAWDRAAARSAKAYLANSTSVRGRIEQAYGIESDILHPPVAIDVSGPQRPLPGVEAGSYWLTVSRSRGYKNAAVICEAVEARSDEQLLLIGDLPERRAGRAWSHRIQSAQRVSDEQLRWAYANCRGLVAASYEDFGLTPIEANAFGRPVAALRAGGYLDTVMEGVNGVFFDEADVQLVSEALDHLQRSVLSEGPIRAHADWFSEARFAARLRGLIYNHAM